jgi:hypothetical protein
MSVSMVEYQNRFASSLLQAFKIDLKFDLSSSPFGADSVSLKAGAICRSDIAFEYGHVDDS